MQNSGYQSSRRRNLFSVSLLVLAVFADTIPTAIAQVCNSELLAPYQDCVQKNSPCPCSKCDFDPTDDTPEIVAKTPYDCFDVEDIFCPLVKCCSACESEARTWYETCSGKAFAEFHLGFSCSLQCDSFRFLDFCDLTERPTWSPVESPSASPSHVTSDSPSDLPSVVPSLASSSAPSVERTESPSAMVTSGAAPNAFTQSGRDVTSSAIASKHMMQWLMVAGFFGFAVLSL